MGGSVAATTLGAGELAGAGAAWGAPAATGVGGAAGGTAAGIEGADSAGFSGFGPHFERMSSNSGSAFFLTAEQTVTMASLSASLRMSAISRLALSAAIL
ncbi:MAG: hypothetical protein A2V70_01240 [Planctomycetes bacterium RBG_13_63_9]|nr:MAG: hypothetical protein A2V70_01240 [Planctomycetes bacterium RBG_13_63_9]